MREPAYVTHELFGQRAIEAVLRAQGLANVLADVWVVHDRAEWIAGREMNEREADGRDERDDYRGLRKPSREVAEHPLELFLTGSRWRDRRSRRVVAWQSLVCRNRPVGDVRPPRVRP